MEKTETLKPRGTWEVRRKIEIPTLADEAAASQVVQALQALPGVKGVAADSRRRQVTLRYDSTETDYRSIVTLLEGIGYPAPNRWWANLKGSWYQFIDSNARENAHIPASPCCNKPPKPR